MEWIKEKCVVFSKTVLIFPYILLCEVHNYNVKVSWEKWNFMVFYSPSSSKSVYNIIVQAKANK